MSGSSVVSGFPASRLAVWLGLLLLAGCGGGGTDSGSGSPQVPMPPAAVVSIAGTVSGSTGPVTLLLNGGSSLTLNADGVFTFGTTLSSGAPYSVTIVAASPDQACTVANGAGTAGTSNISNVTVTCVAAVGSTYAVSGTLSGAAGSVALRLNGTGELLLTGDRAFTF